MSILELQKGVLQWFGLESGQAKSFASIDNVCVNLYKQLLPFQQAKNAKYEIFFPLVRYGVVEFYGENKYGLAPSSALSSEKYILLCNIPHSTLEYQTPTLVLDTQLGIKVYKNTPSAISFLNAGRIPSNQFQLSEALAKMNFESILNSWEDSKVIEPKQYVLFDHASGWVNPKGYQKIGVYKKSKEPFAQRVLQIQEHQWKSIPSRENNLDAFNLAVTWSQLQRSGELKIKYYRSQRKLVVSDVFFPLIVERLLLLNSLLQVPEPDVTKQHYFLGESDFNVLNNLFGNRINAV